jgi:hypothetical protein
MDLLRQRFLQRHIGEEGHLREIRQHIKDNPNLYVPEQRQRHPFPPNIGPRMMYDV